MSEQLAEEALDLVETEQEQEVVAPEQEELELVLEGEESPPSEQDQEPDNKVIRELRQAHREALKELKQLKQQVPQTRAPEILNPGEKPTLQQFEYDPDAFQVALDEWYAKKANFERAQAAQKAAQEQAQQAFAQIVQGHNQKKAELKFADVEQVEQEVASMLSPVQQEVLLRYTQNSALVAYALGKRPEKLKQVSEINDPIKLAIELRELERALKVQKRTTPPPPERTVTGSARLSASDTTLEKLREEADRTGDRTKVAAYLRSQKAKR